MTKLLRGFHSCFFSPESVAKLRLVFAVKMMKKILFICVAISLYFLENEDVLSQGWKQWRGPFANGSTTTVNLPVEWSASTNIVWGIPLPGASAATPIIFNTNIFVLSTGSYDRLLLLNIGMKNGTVLWEKEFARYKEEETGVSNESLAYCSPVTDGKTVWALFGSGDIGAYSFWEEEVWRRNLGEELGKVSYGENMLLWEDKLYLSIAKDVQSWILCLDAKTGKTLWKQAIKRAWRKGSKGTIIPYEGENETQLIISDGASVSGHRLENGEEIWLYEGLSGKDADQVEFSSASVPVPALGLVFACGVGNGKLVAIQVDKAKGLLKKEDLIWQSEDEMSLVSSPLYYKEKLYVLGRKEGKESLLTCYNPQTGKVQWCGKVSAPEVFSSSPTGADDKIYGLAESGDVWIWGTGEKYEEIARIKMGEEVDKSGIAISNERIFIRTSGKLYCVKKRRWIRFMDNVFLD